MITILLVLELFLPGNAEPIRGQIPMPDLATCQHRAEQFTATFERENPEGGQAMAGCAVMIPQKKDS